MTCLQNASRLFSSLQYIYGLCKSRGTWLQPHFQANWMSNTLNFGSQPWKLLIVDQILRAVILKSWNSNLSLCLNLKWRPLYQVSPRLIFRGSQINRLKVAKTRLNLEWWHHYLCKLRSVLFLLESLWSPCKPQRILFWTIQIGSKRLPEMTTDSPYQ